MTNLLCAFLMCSLTASLFAETVEAITKPSADVTLSFVRAGGIKSISVKHGDRIQKGQLLAELENKLLQHNVELEQIKNHLRDTQLSLQLVLSSYQGLAEEVSTLFDALRAMIAPSSKNEFSFSFRKHTNNDDDNWN